MVTVIIPNYNHARFLDERIRSVLNQTYQDYEVMILDDCSTDDSLEVINRYRNHPKVAKIVVNEKNSGSPFKQWQKGIAMAKGEIIWIAESDDSCEPTFLETLVNRYEESKAVLAFCRSKRIDDKGGTLSNHFQDVLTHDFVMDGKVFCYQYLTQNALVQNISSAIFSRAVATELPLSYIDFRGAGDWLFSIELTQRGKVAYINEPLNHYRAYAGNTTSNEQQNGHGAKEVKRIYDMFREKGFLTEEEYRKHKKGRLRQIQFSGYSKSVRAELLNLWGATLTDRLWLQILSLYNSLLSLKMNLIKSDDTHCK